MRACAVPGVGGRDLRLRLQPAGVVDGRERGAPGLASRQIDTEVHAEQADQYPNGPTGPRIV